MILSNQPFFFTFTRSLFSYFEKCSKEIFIIIIIIAHYYELLHLYSNKKERKIYITYNFFMSLMVMMMNTRTHTHTVNICSFN
jgi:hypothetical protein